MNSVTFIVCNSGLGHFRRCIRIAHQLIETIDKIKITIYCHPSKIEITSDWPVLKQLQSSNQFGFKPLLNSPQLLKDESAYTHEMLFDWHQSISRADVMEAEIVISDNLPGILNWRQDAILMGSFLWCEILPLIYPDNEMIQEFAAYELNLLTKHKPYMICLKDMAMDYVLAYTQPIKTGWVVESTQPVNLKKSGKTNILISAGATGLDEEILVGIANELAAVPDFKVYTSTRILQRLGQNNLDISAFDFQEESFSQLDLMIARPGIGSITDAITYGIPFIATGGNYNPELSFNATRIAELNYGLNFQNNGSSQILEAVKTILSPNQLPNFQNALKAAPRNGADETVKFLQNQLNRSAIKPNA